MSSHQHRISLLLPFISNNFYNKQISLSLSLSDPCAAFPVVGPCKGIFPRWYYDSKTGDCQHFQYGGCKGNHNNFLQKSDCVNECIQKPTSESEAKLCRTVVFQEQIWTDLDTITMLLLPFEKK
uniref:BPTI/Kunitz inhibitor domain-containing protein n=1 Tax=Sinocyclocheilus grahami TaxID=75366 RepID=A0A672M2K8_SINGR